MRETGGRGAVVDLVGLLNRTRKGKKYRYSNCRPATTYDAVKTPSDTKRDVCDRHDRHNHRRTSTSTPPLSCVRATPFPQFMTFVVVFGE